MNLPKPKKIPVTFNYTAETIGAVASVAAVTYTADAMFEQFQLSDKILNGITLLNSNFVKMMTLMTSNLIKSDQMAEETDLESKKGGEERVKAPTTELDGLLDTLKTMLNTFSVLVGATFITMLDESKKKLAKNTLAFSLAVNHFADRMKDTSKIFETSINKIVGSIEGMGTKIQRMVRNAYISMEYRIDATAKKFDIPKLEKAVAQKADSFAERLKGIKTFTETLREDLRAIGRFITNVSKIFSKVTKYVYETIMVVARGVDAFLDSGVFKLLRRFSGIIGTVFKKLLWPIQLVLSVMDFFDGFKEGYAKEGVVEGIRLGLVKVFDGFFGSLVEIVDWVISEALAMIGLEETSKSFSTGFNKNWEDVKAVFTSILDIFKGIVQFDPEAIWKGIVGVDKGMKDFIIDIFSGAFSLIAGLVKDISGVDMETKVKKIVVWFKNEALNALQSMFQGIVDNIIGAVRWLIEKTVPFGTDVANKLFGARDVTKEEIDEKAKVVAEQRASDKVWNEGKAGYMLKAVGNQIGLRKDYVNEPITEADREVAKQQLRDEGRSIPEDHKMNKLEDIKDKPNITSKNNVDTIQSPKVTPTEGLTKALEQKTKEEKKEKPSVIMNNQNNVNNSSMNRSSSGGVIMLGANEKASFATPASRYSVR